ncbi:MAG: hypothetical protein HXY43_00950 [Fischerella sp.]|jgi:hypothetical protein|uniref:hypothetical protein n=1 Tax=unclassified Fischerella TaxID=494603 RepID=UPI000551C4F3|nr:MULTISPECIES: hypothetical protein [unclassified Fischerella]NWF57910.1 hypothetical protein [Fischerella sp.]
MSNREHLAQLRLGVHVWNEQQRKNPNIISHLSGANLNQAEIKLVRTESTTREVPKLRAKLLSVLLAGGIEGLRTMLNHPLVDILIEMMKKWLDSII